ncbi:MAG TPA: response regulator [Geobacteraceae bacterium]
MQELSQQPQTGFRQEQRDKVILVVDDEAIIRDLCIRALKGYRVLEAANGEEALKLFAQGGIDVILTDVMMPRMTGIELLKRLKEIEPTIVAIVMTGFAEKDVILNALKADADDFIAKPLNLLQLKTAVDKALVKKSLKEEIANLKSIDRFKTNFLSLVSHKFRTPMTAISLFLQNLAGGLYDPADPSSVTNLRLVYEQSCYLEQLVADLLAFSRFMETDGRLNLEPCSLDAVITQIVAESREAADKPGVNSAFDLQEVPPLLLDREKIGFALKQIIDNAYKFSSDGGRVTITLAREKEAILLVVADRGIGIAGEDLPKIFEKFYQVDAGATGQIRGFGLGLYYAREFLRQHGASIAVESQPGTGTTVTVTFPLPA